MNRSYQILDWDTKYFKYTVALISESLPLNQISELLTRMKSDGVRLAYWFVNFSDERKNNAATELGGFLADEKVTYIKRLDKSVQIEQNENIKSFLHKPLTDVLLLLVLQSGVFSRFSVDKHFSHGEFEILYKQWIEKSLSGEKALDVLVYVLDNKEVGLLTLEEKNSIVAIGLLAVDTNYRKQHIGSHLLSSAMQRTKQLGYDTIEVVTQKRNIVACKFYEKNGFVLENQKNIYHFWL